MADIPFIDLHPDKIPGTGPEEALGACRRFLDEALRKGWRQVRIITGIGIHGDGSPRLRSRVEREILGSFYMSIAAQHYEQGGAVILLELHPPKPARGGRELRNLAKEKEHQGFVEREERVMVALERFEAAENYLQEGDLRRARLKVNQILREFAPESAPAMPDQASIKQALRELKKKIDALS